MVAKKTTIPVSPTFDKELFKRSVLYNVRTLYRKTMEEATPQQIFQAVSYAVKDQIVENWMETQKQYEKKDVKTVYYLSMEFLMGRALGNNLINMQAFAQAKEALEELGVDINVADILRKPWHTPVRPAAQSSPPDRFLARADRRVRLHHSQPRPKPSRDRRQPLSHRSGSQRHHNIPHTLHHAHGLPHPRLHREPSQRERTHHA